MGLWDPKWDPKTRVAWWGLSRWEGNSGCLDVLSALSIRARAAERRHVTEAPAVEPDTAYGSETRSLAASSVRSSITFFVHSSYLSTWTLRGKMLTLPLRYFCSFFSKS